MAAKTLWKVNGSVIPNAEIRREAASIRLEIESQGRELTMEDRLILPEQARERLIERAILRTSAHRLGFSPSAGEIEAALARLAPRNDGVSGCRVGMASEENIEDIRDRLAIDKMMQACLDKARRPQAWQIEEFYRKHLEHFWTPPLAHVFHVVKNFSEDGSNEIEAWSAVEHMRQRLLAGAGFAEVAKAESDCPEHGGDLGYFAQGTMVEEFDAIVFAAPIGELTPVFRTRFGAHVALVKDRKPAGIRPLDEVEREIESILHRQAQDAACGALLAKLQKSARIEQVVS